MDATENQVLIEGVWVPLSAVPAALVFAGLNIADLEDAVIRDATEDEQ